VCCCLSLFERTAAAAVEAALQQVEVRGCVCVCVVCCLSLFERTAAAAVEAALQQQQQQQVEVRGCVCVCGVV